MRASESVGAAAGIGAGDAGSSGRGDVDAGSSTLSARPRLDRRGGEIVASVEGRGRRRGKGGGAST